MYRRIQCDLQNILLGVRLKALLFALLATLSLLTSSLMPLVANASSIYDNAFKSTDELILGSHGEPYVEGPNTFNCTDQDRTLTWSDYVTGNADYYFYSNGPSDEDMQESFAQALETGRWGVTQIYNGGGDYLAFTIYWTEGDDLQLNWLDLGGGITGVQATGSSSDTMKYAEVNCRPNHGEEIQVGFSDGGTTNYDYFTSLNNAPGSYPFKTLFVYTDNPNYPPGYEGDDVPDSPPTPATELYPGVAYQVDNKKLNAQYLKNLPYRSHVDWSIWKTDDSYTIPPGSSPLDYKSKLITNDSNYSYTFTEHGKYVMIVDSRCQAPYACPPLPDTDPEATYDYGVTAIQLNIDGSTFSGDTDDPDCSSGVCEANNPYLDCSEFGGVPPYGFGGGEFPDIIGGIGCVWQNFGIFLGILLTSLFVPNTDFIASYFEEFSEYLNEKLGFIWQSIAELVGVITQTIGAAVSPDCSLDPEGELFGASIHFDLCEVEDMIPAIYSLIQIILVGGTLVVLLFAMVRRYQGVVDHR